jgi:hypothetical protein
LIFSTNVADSALLAETLSYHPDHEQVQHYLNATALHDASKQLAMTIELRHIHGIGMRKTDNENE